LFTPFQCDQFAQLLPHWTIRYRPESDSTNAWARREVEQGDVTSGAVYLAEYQSSGVGRRGSKWQSAPGENLLFTAVVEVDLASELLGRIAIAVGVAVASVLGRYAGDVAVKWPNDVYVGNEKIAGILVEQVGEFTLIGIGVNIFAKEFPEEVNATSLALVSYGEFTREQILAYLLQQIMSALSLCEEHFSKVLELYQSVDWLAGKFIRCTVGQEIHCGKVLGVSNDAELILETEHGVRKLAAAHEIRVIVVNLS